MSFEDSSFKHNQGAELELNKALELEILSSLRQIASSPNLKAEERRIFAETYERLCNQFADGVEPMASYWGGGK